MENPFFRGSSQGHMCWPLTRMLAVGICCVIVFGALPGQIKAAEQPSWEEMARIFEQVGREKNIPPEILKAIAYKESGWGQFYADGRPKIADGKYVGVMQVTMLDSLDAETRYKIQYDVCFNVAYGADILNEKWEMAPNIGNGDRTVVENWYFAIWAYNSWIVYNNPNTAREAGRTAYQDSVFQIMADHPYGADLATPIAATPYNFPAGSLPSKGETYLTPTPAHYSIELAN
ncbi:MAG: transglycosylase SLT domain-containing protein [Peptococcaceae bacterium]|nr:transglycosylase SLT domain-containing protein [Peptococcaceae bacterium]